MLGERMQSGDTSPASKALLLFEPHVENIVPCVWVSEILNYKQFITYHSCALESQLAVLAVLYARYFGDFGVCPLKRHMEKP